MGKWGMCVFPYVYPQAYRLQAKQTFRIVIIGNIARAPVALASVYLDLSCFPKSLIGLASLSSAVACAFSLMHSYFISVSHQLSLFAFVPLAQDRIICA